MVKIPPVKFTSLDCITILAAKMCNLYLALYWKHLIITYTKELEKYNFFRIREDIRNTTRISSGGDNANSLLSKNVLNVFYRFNNFGPYPTYDTFSSS
jgi:hypothetical protein